MSPRLSLFEDVYKDTAVANMSAGIRMFFVAHGSVTIDGRAYPGGSVWFGEGGVACTGGPEGATVWRFELSKGEVDQLDASDVSTRTKLSAMLSSLPEGELLFRGDSVAPPPGGTALTHRHQGPGIRCMVEGAIRIDTHGRSTSYGAGGAWFETGPDAVFAQADLVRPSRFIRAMVLPRALLGQSSIRYVREEDKNKPKSQTYKVFVDRPISFADK